MSAKPSKNPRQSVRFQPENTTLAYAQFFDGMTLKNEVRGIVRDESYTGCCVIFQKTSGISKETFGRIRVGDLAPLKFHVVWVVEMKDGFVKCGIEYGE